MDEREVALYFFRKTVYALYLEIGALNIEVHEQLAKKADLKNAFFQRDKEKMASAMYREIETETDTAKILAPFEQRTGLTFDDVQRLLVEGDWRNKRGGYTFGGPRWVRIVEALRELREKIDQEAWEETGDLVYQLKGLKTNRGYLINQFERSERGR